MTNATQEKNDAILALHVEAKAYPGGIAALAGLIGRSPGVLHNKFSDSMPQYEITDREADALALAITAKTGKQGYIEAKCQTHGGIFVPVIEGTAAEDDLLQAQLEMIRRFGDLAQQFTEARADGIITEDEFAVVRVAGNRVIRAVHEFVQEVGSRVRETPPAAPVALVSGAADR